MHRSSAAVLMLLGCAACAHEAVLEPAAGAPLAPGKNDVADTVSAGVRVFVAGDAWRGDPTNLASLYTPVRLRIENLSGKTLRVSYRDFKLTGGSGFQYAAIPPINAAGRVSAAATPRAQPSFQLARWEHHGFYIAPHYSPFYPGIEPWVGGFPYSPPYYEGYYRQWSEKLPTKDMISEALPEGAVQDGGDVAGFVYFQSVNGRESTVRFEMSLVDTDTGQSFGSVSIPFQTKGG